MHVFLQVLPYFYKKNVKIPVMNQKHHPELLRGHFHLKATVNKILVFSPKIDVFALKMSFYLRLKIFLPEYAQNIELTNPPSFPFQQKYR